MYKFLVGVGKSKDTKGLTERSTKYSPIRERMSFGFRRETLGGRDTLTRVFNLGAPWEARRPCFVSHSNGFTALVDMS